MALLPGHIGGSEAHRCRGGFGGAPIITYDNRLAEAARARGIEVIAPVDSHKELRRP